MATTESETSERTEIIKQFKKIFTGDKYKNFGIYATRKHEEMKGWLSSSGGSALGTGDYTTTTTYNQKVGQNISFDSLSKSYLNFSDSDEGNAGRYFSKINDGIYPTILLRIYEFHLALTDEVNYNKFKGEIQSMVINEECMFHITDLLHEEILYQLFIYICHIFVEILEANREFINSNPSLIANLPQILWDFIKRVSTIVEVTIPEESKINEIIIEYSRNQEEQQLCYELLNCQDDTCKREKCEKCNIQQLKELAECTGGGRKRKRIKTKRRIDKRETKTKRRISRARRINKGNKTKRTSNKRSKRINDKRKDKRSRRKTKESKESKKRSKNNKQSNGLPKIFVINLKRDGEKWSKYKKDDRYIRFSACNGVEMSKENPYFDRLQIMWNAADRKKKCTAGILNSHMSIIKKIVKQKINQALVIEDDAVIDFKMLEKINLNNLPQDSIIYFGGTLHPPDTFKNKTWTHEETIKSFKKGINKIDSKKFRILGGHGYYFPTWETAKDLLDKVDTKKKMRALDSEMVKLQRSQDIKYFYYPAISYLKMEDAKKGVHAVHMERDMKFYGGGD
jgi:GR25 family glycosyltransferase involved in LPS biosynthesis